MKSKGPVNQHKNMAMGCAVNAPIKKMALGGAVVGPTVGAAGPVGGAPRPARPAFNPAMGGARPSRMPLGAPTGAQAPVGMPASPVPRPTLGGTMSPLEAMRRNNGVPGMKKGGNVAKKSK